MQNTLPTLYQQTKVCTKCGVDKALTEYSKHKQQRNGLHPRCKACRKEEYRLARQKEGHQARARAHHLRRKYGINASEYDVLLAAQNGCCAICNSTSHTPLHVDHCHRTEKVRGLLCMNCNHAIGKFKDNPALLRSAADYLEGING
jgi:hypothetical protein